MAAWFKRRSASVQTVPRVYHEEVTETIVVVCTPENRIRWMHVGTPHRFIRRFRSEVKLRMRCLCHDMCICVYMCSCAYLCMYMYVCIPMCTCVCICVCLCMCEYLCVYVYLCLPVYVHVCVYTYVYLCMYVCGCVCVCIYLCIHVLGSAGSFCRFRSKVMPLINRKPALISSIYLGLCSVMCVNIQAQIQGPHSPHAPSPLIMVSFIPCYLFVILTFI